MARSISRPISVARRPISSMLLPIPVVCFVGTLLTDLSYVNSGGNLFWVNFSSWLITAGLVFGAAAILILIIDTLRGAGTGWLPPAVVAGAWIMELMNALIHARDGWTSVVPTGMILSIFGALLILIGGWLSRHDVVGDVR